MAMCEKDDNPAHQKGRFFIASKKLVLSLDIYLTLKKSLIKRFVYPILGLLYHKRYLLIATVVDGAGDITFTHVLQ